jgi:hypothetical protein
MELVQHGSQSLMIVLGNPNNFTSRLNCKAAVSLAVTLTVVVMNCANLVSLSTTTNIMFFPCDSGNPVMKSSEIISKGEAGIAKG